MNTTTRKKICDLSWFSPKSDRSKYFLYVLFFFCFEPKLFAKVPLLNGLFAGGAVACFVLMCGLYLSSRKKPSILLAAVVVYRLSFAIQTFTAPEGDVLMWGYMSIVLMTMCMAVDYYIADKSREMIEAVTYLLVYLLVVNMVVSLFWPEGIFDMYFIGIRTRLTDLIIPMIVLALVLDWIDCRNMSFRTVAILLLAVLTVYQHTVMTAVLGLGIFAAFFAVFFFFRKKWVPRAVNVCTLAGVGLLLDTLIVHAKITLRMEWFFVNVLNKTATLTERMAIWENAMVIIKDRIWLGHGMAENGNFVPGPESLDASVLWQAHNQWIQLLYDGGLLAVVAFLALALLCHRGLRGNCPHRPRIAFLAGLLAFFVMMSVEIFSYTPYFFLLVFFGYHASTLRQSDEVRLGLVEQKALKYSREQ
ncbi:MAG: O-antigen ligase family protein [Clostridia bacterium]|nr:O-antigen ligase family protein [Clostridia bacterium]